MSNIKFPLTREQEDFLRKLQRMDAPGSPVVLVSTPFPFRSRYSCIIKTILKRGYYTIDQKKTLSEFVIPRYKKYMKNFKIRCIIN